MAETENKKFDTYPDIADELDLTAEIDLSDIFDEEKKAEGIGDETLILSKGELNGIRDKAGDEEDLEKTKVLDLSDIPYPWRDEEDEVLDLFGKEGRTKVRAGDENAPKETLILDRKKLKDGLAEEEPEEGQGSISREEAPAEYSEEEHGGKKRKHYKTHFFLKSFLLLAALLVTVAFALSPVFTIRDIKVEGNRFYTEEQIINMSNASVGGNLFLDADKSGIKKNLGDNIYFRSVRVRRKIPSTIVIDVDEREELAALKYGDRYVVIDEDAVVLRIAQLDPEVTEITGLKIMKMEQGEAVEVEEKKIFQDTLSTLHTMKEGDLFFKRIEIEDQTITAFVYDMLKVRGSSEELRSAIESGALQKVMNKLMKNEIKRGTIILGEDDYISFSPAV